MKKKHVAVICILAGIIIVFWFSNQGIKNTRQKVDVEQIIELQQAAEVDSAVFHIPKKQSPAIRILDSMGLVNIRELNPAIGVQLKYATTDNFTGQILYDGLTDAYLQPEVAAMLSEAQRLLQKQHPELRLLVYDAARPLSVQQAMWDYVKNTPYRNYIAHPEKTGLHNYGAAVDLTIADSTWNPLDMGTTFDFFGKAAGTANESELLEQGVLTVRQVENRQLLRKIMQQAGFRSISGEWWHFNACTLNEARNRYSLIEHF